MVPESPTGSKKKGFFCRDCPSEAHIFSIKIEVFKAHVENPFVVSVRGAGLVVGVVSELPRQHLRPGAQRPRPPAALHGDHPALLQGGAVLAQGESAFTKGNGKQDCLE